MSGYYFAAHKTKTTGRPTRETTQLEKNHPPRNDSSPLEFFKPPHLHTLATCTKKHQDDIVPSRVLDKMLGAEIGTQVHNLPGPKTNQNPRGRHAEPLDAVVGALIRIAKLLLPLAEVVHLVDNLLGQFLDTAEFGLDRLELLGGLDGAPVFGIGANVNVELDVARGRVRSTGYIQSACTSPMAKKHRFTYILKADSQSRHQKQRQCETETSLSTRRQYL